uniref:Amino acid transporter transmembrane domain-containing protein n=1 Tax=Timema monikensis TaxID=170555 RepID=A0A7R9HPP1_9NEOP|nr:unnamed protein product [Timema monikensis]
MNAPRRADVRFIVSSLSPGQVRSTVHLVEKPPLEDYNPHLERHVDHPTNNCETLLHMLKGSLGTGILAMPNAFLHSGYVLGTVGTLAIGLICTYCIHMLCGYELCKRRRLPSLNFPNTTKVAMEEGPRLFRCCAPYSGHVVNVFLLIYQLGTCCVYVVFISTNIKEVCDVYLPPLDVRVFMVFLLLPLILINWIRNLKLLAPFSTAANIITFVGFGIILYYLVTQVETLADKEPLGELAHIPLFFGTVLFALEAIGVILPLENNMKTPGSFGGVFGVLNQAMITIILLYVGMGFLGYMTYGTATAGSITINLPKDQPLAQSVKLMLSVAIFVSHGLQCYIAVDIAWGQYLLPRLEKHRHRTFIENTETLIHLLKGSLGTGILAMPNAFLKAGLAVGTVGTILIGSLCIYCLHILVFISFVGEFCHCLQVGDKYYREMDVKIYMLILLGPLILINYIRNLKLLAPFSVFANIITFVGLGITMYYLFDGIPSPMERQLVGDVKDYPLFIGTTLFALEAVGVVHYTGFFNKCMSVVVFQIIALENNMKKPQDFGGYTGVLNKGMSVIVFLYVFVGFVGYLKYGENAMGSVTLNLPTDEILAQSVKIMFAVAIFITYALQCYVPVEIVWNTYLKERMAKRSETMQTLVEYLMRTAMVLGTCEYFYWCLLELGITHISVNA